MAAPEHGVWSVQPLFSCLMAKTDCNANAELSAQQIGPVHYVHESYPAHDRLLAMSWTDASFSEQMQLVTASSDQGVMLKTCKLVQGSPIALTDHNSTLLQLFTVSSQKGALSEAFAKMECRKADIREGPVTWVRTVSGADKCSKLIRLRRFQSWRRIACRQGL